MFYNDTLAARAGLAPQGGEGGGGGGGGEKFVVSPHPGQRLTHMLSKAEWDAVGGRYWIVCMIEILLTSLLPSSASLQPTHPSLVVESPRYGGGGGGGGVGGGGGGGGEEKLLSLLHTAKAALGPTLLSSLRLLLHADLTLARGLWLPLIQTAWSSFSSSSSSSSSSLPNEGQNLMVPGMVSVLTRGSHR